MKSRWLPVIAGAVLVIGMTAANCVTAAATGTQAPAPEKPNKTLVVYFDWESENDPAVSNEELLARMLAVKAGGDVFEIVPETPYPTDEAKLEAVNDQERMSNARPAMADIPQDWKDYSTVYIGYPVTDEEMPMIIYTFLEQNDFTGKTVIPFDVYDGRTMEGMEVTIATETGVDTQSALNVSRELMQTDRDSVAGVVDEWMEKFGIDR